MQWEIALILCSEQFLYILNNLVYTKQLKEKESMEERQNMLLSFGI